MFGWFDEQGASKVFWYKETPGGNQKLVRPDGTYRIMRERNKYCEELGKQALAGFQRAKLLMQEYGIWDGTSFACTLATLLGVKTDRYENGERICYIFASPQRAEEDLYYYLSEEDVETCRRNVEEFYGDVNLQAAWHSFILHPVCFRVYKETGKVVPVAIKSIGCGEGVLGQYEFIMVGTLRDGDWMGDMFWEDVEDEF